MVIIVKYYISSDQSVIKLQFCIEKSLKFMEILSLSLLLVLVTVYDLAVNSES